MDSYEKKHEKHNEHLEKIKIDWITSIFLILTPILSLIWVPSYFISGNFSWATVVFAIFMYFATSMAITGGYHRLFAHKGYKAKTWVQLMYLLFGAAAFQGSAAKWCTDHRRHHQKMDTNEDPYTIKRGLFYAHIGWLFLAESEKYKDKFDSDLVANPLVRWQNKYFYWVATAMGFGFPALMGSFWGDAWGGFVIAGILRTVLVHHGTFFINSLCHFWGSQPFTDKHTARDNFILAVLTNGEGYHNFHHTFAADYRNGWRWYHWDPTKWLVSTLAGLGQAYQLRKVPDQEIHRYRRLMQQKVLQRKGISQEILEPMLIKIENAQARLKELRAEYRAMRAELKSRSQQRLADSKLRFEQWREASWQKYLSLKAELRVAKIENAKALAQWNAYVRVYA